MTPIVITQENFETEVMSATVPVLLDFWASWCGPCRMLSPIIDKAAESLTDQKIGKINVDEQPDLAKQFGIMSIPTLIVMKDGEIVSRSVGGKSEEEIIEMLDV